uniref:DUF2314 domain-containing protein n=1 Tax=Caenorhabditis tropicalis TaxID=1561998 RepID=A0A1I7UWS7_9PELO
MSSKVDLTDLYPPTTKFLAYRHTDCGSYWYSEGLSSSEIMYCPQCQPVTVQALAAFPLEEDVSAFLAHLKKADNDFKVEAAGVFYYSHQNPIQPLNGSSEEFFRKWLSWEPMFPLPSTLRRTDCIRLMMDQTYQPLDREWLIGEKEDEELLQKINGDRK